MTKIQILNFLKAPFGKSFIVAYLFTLPMLLVIPLIKTFITFFADNYEKIAMISDNSVPQYIMEHYAPYFNKADGIMAAVGLGMTVLLSSVYVLGITRQTVSEGKGIFDASRLSLPMEFICLSVTKYIGVLLAMTAVTLFPMGILIVLCGIGYALGIKVLMAIIGFFLFFILTYKLICYLYTANILFFKGFKVSSYFDYHSVKTYFITHKKNIFIAFLLSYVSGQMINLILGSVFAKIIQITLAMGTVVTLFHLSGSWIIVPGILALNFVWAYLMALHGIVYGKIILWIDRNQE